MYPENPEGTQVIVGSIVIVIPQLLLSSLNCYSHLSIVIVISQFLLSFLNN